MDVIHSKEVMTRTTFEDDVKYMELTEAVFRSIAETRALVLPLKILIEHNVSRT